MQFGHAGIALAISTYDWNTKTIVAVALAHFLPNFDAFPIRLGWADEDFHCSITHTFLFAIIASLGFSLFGAKYGVLVFVSLMAHFIADMGSTVGMPLFYPFWRRRFSWRLWEHTGYWGWETIKGYYVQKWAWISEGLVFAFVIYRLYVII
ncbi:MAG: metal-dependent hydrolase [Candidatus Hodarchaeota archaeon]